MLEQCSKLRSVAVDECTHYITLVYSDPFYELVFTAIYFHDDVSSCNYQVL